MYRLPREIVQEVRQRHEQDKAMGEPRRHEDLAEDLASSEVVTALVLLVGFPPSKPGDAVGDLLRYADFVHAVAMWTVEARCVLLDLWGIETTEYERVRTYSEAFYNVLTKVWQMMGEIKIPEPPRDFALECRHDQAIE